MGHVGSKTSSLGQILEKHCSFTLYHTILSAQVTDSRAILALLFFSSPEHEVLRVSYCDWSVVRPSVCPSVCPSVRLSVHNYKKSSSPKLTIRFQSNFTEMILRSCSFKILQRIEFHEELWLPW